VVFNSSGRESHPRTWTGLCGAELEDSHLAWPGARDHEEAGALVKLTGVRSGTEETECQETLVVIHSYLLYGYLCGARPCPRLQAQW
jgi:hypothetical protein